MMEQQEFNVVASLDLPDVYFVIREFGVQVKVIIKNNQIFPNHNLQIKEVEFFKKQIKYGHN